MTIVIRHPNAIAELWPSTGELCKRLAAQERAREKALRRLARLRRRAAAEIDRLIAVLDASDPFVMNELEEECDDEDAQCEGGGGEEGCEDEGADRSDYEPPPLGGLERHPSLYGPDGRNWTGDQTAWDASGTKDLEDEHDGAEPDESGIGDMEGLLEQVGSQSWQLDGYV
ncbi:hypothetical protein [Bradyrhizobium tunisiense]|jgi:hypothetical protein|uniref:hypothetical protein n=1 Tax=Bradyrhizobium tunisiense TaxID=3278709 RepID=UPI0035D75089